MKESEQELDAESLAARQRRFEEDLVDAYDEELEMEVDDRILDGGEGFTPEARELRKQYFRELFRLQGELVKLQDWIVKTGHRLVVIFEGRDAAGKGGAIKRITQRLNPRVCRVAALPAPNNRERTQWYFQRYVSHLPAGGEMVLFDRSWYNRAGVERVMGFCTEDQARGFLKIVPSFERLMIDSGIILLKYWLEVSPEEQTRRLQSRIEDGRKIWKLSPMDVQSYDKWDEYTRVRDEMFVATDTSAAPWFVARSESKRGVRLNIIKHLLSRVPYESVPGEKVKLPKRKIGKYKEPSPPFKYIPEPY